MTSSTGPSPDVLARWIEEVRRIAEEAGCLLMRGWRTRTGVEHKGAIDLVTAYDLQSEAMITERMRAAFPGHGLVAEERGGDAGHDLAWYVDPLDGTTNFAHGLFVFSVAIGLARAGEPIAGVVHAPALGITWHGALGVGAFRNGVPCRVSSTARLAASVVATGFPYDRARDPDNNVREFARIVVKVQGIRRLGSAAVDLCLVADGSYDGYWEQKLKPWDLCAGAAIARAAGATLTDYAGLPVDVRTGRIVATNGRIHEELRAELLAARAALDRGAPNTE
jgi:myo-inositol-1(or 4)-monophosphatase